MAKSAEQIFNDLMDFAGEDDTIKTVSERQLATLAKALDVLSALTKKGL